MEPSYDLRVHDYAHDSEYEKHSGSHLTPSFSPALTSEAGGGPKLSHDYDFRDISGNYSSPGKDSL